MSKYSEYFTYLKAKYIKIGSVQINEISTDGTMAGNSDLCVPTEKAVKTYVDLHIPDPTTGATAPSTTPSTVGLFYLNTTGKKAYVSMGTGSSADWVILN